MRIAPVVLLGLALAGPILGMFCAQPPDAAGHAAPLSEFSAARAFEVVEEMAKAPHPIGSAEHDRVRDRLIERFRRLGLEVKTRTGRERTFRGAEVELTNILARLRGTTDEPPIVLAAHYDSVAAGPGAGDDASGCAAIVESLRALSLEPAPRRSIVALITDGEEAGLLGAELAVRDIDPWLARVGVVLNFEARGAGGEAFMFETSRDAAWLVRELAACVRRPSTNSLAASVYERMPNDTDLTVFKRAGWQGLNFAFIGDGAAYHTPNDRPGRLDVRSLQQQGEYCLLTARRLSSGELRPEPGEAVWFSVLGRWIVYYPAAWTWTLAAAGALLWFGAVSKAGVREALRSVAAGIVSCAAALAFGFAAMHIIPLVGGAGAHAIGTVVAALGAYVSVRLARFALLSGRPAACDAFGATAVLAAASFAACAWLPGGSFVVQIPMLLAAAAWWRMPDAPSGARLLLAAGAAAFAGMMWFPLLRSASEALGAPALAGLSLLGALWLALAFAPAWTAAAGAKIDR